MLGQVFMSFADGRNVVNAMSEGAHAVVALGHDSDHDAAHRAPLLPSNEFDFEHYKYKSLSLAQHIVVYLRLKASFIFVRAPLCACVVLLLRSYLLDDATSKTHNSCAQALLTYRNKITVGFTLFLGCGLIVLGSVISVHKPNFYLYS